VKPLTIIPSYLTDASDAAALEKCLRSIRVTAGDTTDILVLDDGSPSRDLMDDVERLQDEVAFELQRKPESSGFAKTVNVGLQRCLDEGRDAVLVNADVELIDPAWLDTMLSQPRLYGQGEASVVGGLLLYPTGRIQHAGVYLSKLRSRPGRPWFDHIWRDAPADLPEARLPRLCPVTGALLFVRLECLLSVGILDESFPMGSEDIDYCLRVLRDGRECVYQPKVRAYVADGAFASRRAPKSPPPSRPSERLWEKHGGETIEELVPSGDHLEGTFAADQVTQLRRALKANRKQIKKLARKNARLEGRLAELKARKKSRTASAIASERSVLARARSLSSAILRRRGTTQRAPSERPVQPVRFITSFNDVLYEASGKRCVETFRHWNNAYELWVYIEGEDKVVLHEMEVSLGQAGTTVVRLDDLPLLGEFRELAREVIPIELGGDAPPEMFPGEGPQTGDVWFRKHMIRWFRKIVALDHASDGYAGNLFWIDCDCFSKAPLPRQVIRRAFAGSGVVHMKAGRDHSETGLVGYDLSVPGVTELIEGMKAHYLSGSFASYDRWDDCLALDLQLARTDAPSSRDVAQAVGKGAHVLPSTPFAPYLEHEKGLHSRGLGLMR
jgi:GT2 family glycosyltransferase